MTHMPQFSRRSFIASAAAVGGGLALGFHLPDGIGSAEAAVNPAEDRRHPVMYVADACRGPRRAARQQA